MAVYMSLINVQNVKNVSMMAVSSGVNLLCKLRGHGSGLENWGIVGPKSSTDGVA